MRKVLICFAFILGSAAQAEEVVIAALGDSLTQGYELPAEEGFVPQLQDWLDAEGVEAKILNAGVSGDTTAGGLARVDWTLTPEVDAMIVTLGATTCCAGWTRRRRAATSTASLPLRKRRRWRCSWSA